METFFRHSDYCYTAHEKAALESISLILPFLWALIDYCILLLLWSMRSYTINLDPRGCGGTDPAQRGTKISVLPHLVKELSRRGWHKEAMRKYRILR